MKYAHRLVALIFLLGLGGETRAQFLLPPPPPLPFGGLGVGFGYQGRNLSVTGYLARPSFAGYPYYPPFGYGYGGYRNVKVTYIYSAPPPPLFGPPIVINNNVIVNPPVDPDERAAREALEDERFLRIQPRKRKPEAVAAAPAPPQERPLPGEPAGGFRAIGPKERVRPEAPAPKKPAEMPAPRKPAAPDRAADNPKEENARQVALGKEAFEAGAYGKAERRFQQAIRVEPKEAMAYFLLAQAEFALGKYREAFESIDAGMVLKPDWAGARFRAREVYAGNDDDFTEHRKRLEETVERVPNDFFLLFLSAYELWFDGKQAEARLLFQRALKVAPEKNKPLINRFLLHGLPVARGDR